MGGKRGPHITIAAIKADRDWLRYVENAVSRDDVQIRRFSDRQQGIRFVKEMLPQIVVVGLGRPDFDALGTLDQLLLSSRRVQMAILTVPDCVNNAIEVIRLGPSHYKTSPLSLREFCHRLCCMKEGLSGQRDGGS